jgi:uncharacterized membrane protein YkoI
MLVRFSAPRSWLHPVVLATLMLAPVAGSPSLAAAADQPVVRVVGCNPSSLKSSFKTNVVAAPADSQDDGENDGEVPDDQEAPQETNDPEQQPAIHGSIALSGVNEDDAKAIAAAISAKGLSTISPDAATAAAKDALADAGQRTFQKPKLELENQQAVWSVPATLKNGTNANLELKVDAGNGAILSMECD